MRFSKLLILLCIGVVCKAQNVADCTDAILVCGNANLGLNPAGVGFDEFSLPGNNVPSCQPFNNDTIWLKFVIESAGAFMFDILPIDLEADYDFAIYGPDVTCTTLGSAIRCSSTNPQAAGITALTGLNMEEIDTTEGPGADGNGYLMYIDAEAGDVYYVLIDLPHGSDGFSLIYSGTAALPIDAFANPVPDQYQCDVDTVQDGFTEFNLSHVAPIVAGAQTNTTVTMHNSLNDANLGINALPNPYTNVENPETIIARIETENGCTDTTSFDIWVANTPIRDPVDIAVCSYSPNEIFVLNSIIPEVIDDPTGYIFSYHYSLSDAEANINAITSTGIFISDIPQTIFVRVTSEVNALCYEIVSFEVVVNVITLASQPTNIIVCDDDYDGSVTVSLSEKNEEILNGLPASEFRIYYYPTEEDRLNNTNSTFDRFTNITNPQTIYVLMIENETSCRDYIEFSMRVLPKPKLEFYRDDYIICLNTTDPLIISIPAGYQYYEWSTGQQGANLSSIYINEPGTYSVIVTNRYGCSTEISTQVLPSDVATITDVIIDDFNGQGNSVTILVEGPGNYEYSLSNEFSYQDSNQFTGFLSGYYTVYVRDKNGCGVVSQEILVLDYPKFFTPNGDGIHDYWQIKEIDQFPKSTLLIYNRFGRILHGIKLDSSGWDGTNYDGVALPSSDYWFRLEFEDGRTIKGHFSLKR